MDLLRRITVRRAFAVATAGLAAAGCGVACYAQDDQGAVSQGAYQGPYLAWSGKQPAAAAPPADLAEASYAPAPNYAPSSYVPQAPRNSPAPAAPRPAAAPWPPAGGASDLFPPAPPAAAQAAPAAAAQPPSAPSHVATAAAPVSAAAAEGTTSVRFYSLHRAYGMSPDPIPAPTAGHTVLIGPPDRGAAAQDQNQDQSQDGDAGQGGGKSTAPGDAPGDGQTGDN
jgi:hypothetical protein